MLEVEDIRGMPVSGSGGGRYWQYYNNNIKTAEEWAILEGGKLIFSWLPRKTYYGKIVWLKEVLRCEPKQFTFPPSSPKYIYVTPAEQTFLRLSS